MRSRVRDKSVHFRKPCAACRAVSASIIFIIYGLFSLSAGLENVILNLIERRTVVLFLIQDILLVTYGVFIFQFGVIYGGCGVCQFNNCIRNRLRVGRRTLLHLSHLLLIPTLIYFSTGVIGQILYAASVLTKFPNKDDILTTTIWIACKQSMYKEIFSVIMWSVSMMALIMYWINVFNSSTFKFLWKKGKETKALDYIRDLKSQKPQISLILSNYKVREWAPVGAYSINEEEIITKRTETIFQYTQCFDASGDFKIYPRKKGKGKSTNTSTANYLTKLFRKFLPIKYVKLRLYWCYVWDREKNREDFQEECKKILSEAYETSGREGEYTRIEVKAFLKNFEDSVLVRMSEDGKEPIWANVYVYLIASFFGLSLLYRHLFDLVCADEKEFKFIKRISTDNIINMRKIYDQNTSKDDDGMMEKVYISTPTSFTPVEVDNNILDEIRTTFNPVTPMPFNCETEERVSEVIDTRHMKSSSFISETNPLLD